MELGLPVHLFMAQTFGWKATLAVLVNATFGTYLLRRHLGKTGTPARAEVATDVPTLVGAIHLVFLSLSSRVGSARSVGSTFLAAAQVGQPLAS